jgi:RIO kinase 1
LNENEDLAGEGGNTSDSEEVESEESEEKDVFDSRTPRGHRHEDREAKKASINLSETSSANLHSGAQKSRQSRST